MTRNNQKLKKIEGNLSRNHGNILGIKISSTSKDRLLEEIATSFTKKYKFTIVTPNPEIILASRSDPKLKSILNSSEFSINDGTGIAIASYYLSLPTSSRLTLRIVQSILYAPYVIALFVLKHQSILEHIPVVKGRELFNDLLLLSSRRRYRVYLLGSGNSVADKLAIRLKSKYRKLSIKSSSGPLLDKEGKPVDGQVVSYDKSISEIRKFAPHIVFVAFGAPKQEKFIASNIGKLPVKAMMAVGGTFDYEVGKSKVVRSFARIHLEWLGRLISQPWRLPRIFRAVVVFPILVFLQKVRDK